MDYTMTKQQAKAQIEAKLSHFMGVSPEEASNEHYYRALALILRDLMNTGRKEFVRESDKAGKKKIVYLCMEFLMGRSLKNTLYNLNLTDVFAEALQDYGVKLDKLYDCEPDAGLGNGGLGRLAACYLDGLATQGYHATGYSILYEYGIFKQKLVDGWQTELPDVVSLLQHLPRSDAPRDTLPGGMGLWYSPPQFPAGHRALRTRGGRWTTFGRRLRDASCLCRLVLTDRPSQCQPAPAPARLLPPGGTRRLRPAVGAAPRVRAAICPRQPPVPAGWLPGLCR